MSAIPPLTGSKVPLFEFDVVLAQFGERRLFCEVEEVDVVESWVVKMLEGKPVTFVKPVRSSRGNLPAHFFFAGSIRTPITRQEILGICCPQCWNRGEYQSSDDPLLIGIRIDQGIYRVHERCGYHKKGL